MRDLIAPLMALYDTEALLWREELFHLKEYMYIRK